jgi:hypothetical protein
MAVLFYNPSEEIVWRVISNGRKACARQTRKNAFFFNFFFFEENEMRENVTTGKSKTQRLTGAMTI